MKVDDENGEDRIDEGDDGGQAAWFVEEEEFMGCFQEGKAFNTTPKTMGYLEVQQSYEV